MPVCLRHPDREATARCFVCGKPLCRECVIRRGRLVFCSEECIENYMSTSGRVGAYVARERALQRKKKLTKILVAVALAILALAFGVYVLQSHSPEAKRLKDKGQALKTRLLRH